MTDEREGSENGYLPVSRLAVAAAVVGLASASAVANPLFLVVPIIGCGLALAALADVGREAAPKAGRLAALAGLALSLGFGFQFATYQVIAFSGARSRAVAVAETFVVATGEGRYDDAIAMCRYELMMQSMMSRGSDPPEGDIEVELRRKFVESPPVVALAVCGTIEPRLEEIKAKTISGTTWVATLVVPCPEAPAGEVRIDVTVLRQPMKSKTDRWRVTGQRLRDSG